jgi:hypothetical protein
MGVKICLASLLLVLLAACAAVPRDALETEAVQAVLYVSPKGTGTVCSSTQPCSLLQAQTKVRTLNSAMTGNIIVQLKAGNYTLSTTLNFNGRDGGSNGYYIIYRAETNAMVRLSGGQNLTNWTSVGNGIYKTNVGTLRFRSLYVNGQPATRSREPDGSYYRLKNWNVLDKTVEINASEISRWANFSQVEMVIQKHWDIDRLRLQDYRVINVGGSSNVALGKLTYTSSSYDTNFVSSNGNDNDITTHYASAATDDGPYWQVDLGVAYPLKRIELLTRQDGDFEWSRKNFEVWASNNADMSLGHVVLGGQGDTALPFKATWQVNVSDATPYRYLAVVGTGGTLAFAELRAFKTATANEQSAIVTPQNPERERSFTAAYPPKEPQQAYHFENAPQFLDTPGEFYLNTATREVFYKPRTGETLSTAEVVAPRLETLVNIDGANRLRFEGLSFEHADWLAPSGEGFVGLQAGVYLDGALPAGVSVKNARDIRFYKSAFRNMGASGLNFYSAVSGSSVIGCLFENLGGQGVALGAAPDSGEGQTDVSNSVVKNNYVTKIGQHFTGSVGIFAGYVTGVRIEHNALWDMPYTAISVGWGWNQNETHIRNNTIRYNEIWNALTLHDDGGGIYTLSNQPGTLVAENYIHDLVLSPWAGDYPIVGIYLDEGSSNISVKDNVLLNLPNGIKQNRPGPNNTLVNNNGRSQTVMDNAGPEAGY